MRSCTFHVCIQLLCTSIVEQGQELSIQLKSRTEGLKQKRALLFSSTHFYSPYIHGKCTSLKCWNPKKVILWKNSKKGFIDKQKSYLQCLLRYFLKSRLIMDNNTININNFE